MTTRPPKNLTFKKGDQTLELDNYVDYIVSSGQAKEVSSINDAEIVFVGYGTQAPEYDWDDFKDVDVRGKVLLLMNNDPADDPELFGGRTRLYYGRWDYKYAKAAELGAAGVFIIHTTPSAGYPYQVVQTSWTGEQMALGSGFGAAIADGGLAVRRRRANLSSLQGTIWPRCRNRPKVATSGPWLSTRGIDQHENPGPRNNFR